MTSAEIARHNEERQALAEAHASTLMAELPAIFQDKLRGRVTAQLLSTKEGFDDRGARALVAEKVAEWAELPGYESYRVLGRELLARLEDNDR